MVANSRVVTAFSDEQVARLTGLSTQQLRHWDRSGFFVPSMANPDRHVNLSRVYSFLDLLELQVLKMLRKDHKCSLRHLREVKRKLEEIGESRWSQVVLYVLNRRVVSYDKQNDKLEDVVSSQQIMKIPLMVVKTDMTEKISELLARPEDLIGSFDKKRNVVHNSLVVSGTRVPVAAIIDFIDSGFSDDAIVSEFPSVTFADVQAVRRSQAA